MCLLELRDYSGSLWRGGCPRQRGRRILVKFGENEIDRIERKRKS